MKAARGWREALRVAPMFALKSGALIGLVMWLAARGVCVAIWQKLRAM
jgi:hypothetical protein